jgi:hypothetical protein
MVEYVIVLTMKYPNHELVSTTIIIFRTFVQKYIYFRQSCKILIHKVIQKKAIHEIDSDPIIRFMLSSSGFRVFSEFGWRSVRGGGEVNPPD